MATQYRRVITRHAPAALCWITDVTYVRTLALMSLVADPAPPLLLPQPESASAPTTATAPTTAAAPTRRKKPEVAAAKRSADITAITQERRHEHTCPSPPCAERGGATTTASGSAPAATSHSPNACSRASPTTSASCLSTRMPGRARSSRSRACPTTRSWCWAWSRPSSTSWRRPSHLLARIDEAANFYPRDQLAISTQCGFSSAGPGNAISEDAQERKLQLVADVAHRAWG